MGGLELVSRFQNWTKNMLEMLFTSYTNISSSFLVILSNIHKNVMLKFVDSWKKKNLNI